MFVEDLKTFEQTELLRWFLHHMGMEQRHDLAKTYPQHYRKLCDHDSVTVDFGSLVIETQKDA